MPAHTSAQVWTNISKAPINENRFFRCVVLLSNYNYVYADELLFLYWLNLRNIFIIHIQFIWILFGRGIKSSDYETVMDGTVHDDYVVLTSPSRWNWILITETNKQVQKIVLLWCKLNLNRRYYCDLIEQIFRMVWPRWSQNISCHIHVAVAFNLSMKMEKAIVLLRSAHRRKTQCPCVDAKIVMWTAATATAHVYLQESFLRSFSSEFLPFEAKSNTRSYIVLKQSHLWPQLPANQMFGSTFFGSLITNAIHYCFPLRRTDLRLQLAKL